MIDISHINSRSRLAEYLHIPLGKLTYILYKQGVDSLYSTFEIPKRNGEMRQINAPTGDLKIIQKQLAVKLWELQQAIWKEKNVHPNLSHGFQKDKSIITNAKIHRNKKFVLNIDLADFFASFHFGRVRGYFHKNRHFNLPIEVATIIAQLTCYKGSLPQGAPSSPIITNNICQVMDISLLKIAKRYKLDYTRYADDLTFSTNRKSFLDEYTDFFCALEREIGHAGFSINERKTRLQYRDSRQTVTGLIVNKKLNVAREYYKKTRSMAHSLYTKGAFSIGENDGTIKQLEGRFAFINWLDDYNHEETKDKQFFRDIKGREKQYQWFLFYRYFYSNSKPLLVTEGKTDSVYLKAALKSLHMEYPNLVAKNSDDKFEYKISFLRRTERIRDFLGISLDGADAITTFYDYFYKEKILYTEMVNTEHIQTKSNRFLFFKRKLAAGMPPTNPVILLFDNENSENGEGKDKPLKKFASKGRMNKDEEDLLRKELSIQLGGNECNLFLLTYPLVDGKKECEIEDLFDKKTLEHAESGKTFNPDEKSFNDNEHYGKKNFADYVSKNYETIDFSGFRPVLDRLSDIIAKTTPTL